MSNIEYSQVIQQIKNWLTRTEAKDINKINLALAMAMDDLGTRIKSDSFKRNYTIATAVDERSWTLSGSNSDLKDILYIQAGSGDNENLLIPTGMTEFLEEYDGDNVTAGLPKRYALYEASGGFPVIKTDVPFAEVSTLTVHYITSAGATDAGAFRSKSILVAGSIAYYYGPTTEKGIPPYSQFRSLIKAVRESDSFEAKGTKSFTVSKDDKLMNAVAASMRGRR